MRLIELKKRLENILVNNQIELNATQGFNGYAYQINNGPALFAALELLSKQSWNNQDFAPIQQLIEKYNALLNNVINVEQAEYKQLRNYIAELNQRLPLFMGIIDHVTEEQEPQDINIKLSTEITTVEKLKKITEEINNLTKVSNVDGQGIVFKGFDKGTEWIVLGAVGPVTYTVIMASLKLAQEVLKTKKEYYNSKTAELDYRASLTESTKYTQKGQEEYQKKRTEVQIELGVEEITDKVSETNGFEKNEIKTKVRKTTDCIIRIIDEGNEVHASLNPPAEIQEGESGIINIDYSYLEKGLKKTQPKELEAKNEETGQEGDE